MTGLDVSQVLNLVVRPTLARLDLAQRGIASAAAEALLLGTAAQESGFKWIAQVGGGPALGLWQMEPATHDDLFRNYLAYHTKLRDAVLSFSCSAMSTQQQLAGNALYAAACCRAQFFRSPKPLPAATDIDGLARMWKDVWNTPAGAGTVAQFKQNWLSFGLSGVLAK